MTMECIDRGDKLAGNENGHAAAADDQSTGFATFFLDKPGKHQGHGHNISKTTAYSRAEIEKGNACHCLRLADHNHGKANKEQGSRDEHSVRYFFCHLAYHQNRNEIANKVNGTYESALGIAKAQFLCHRGEEHAEGKSAKAKTG